MATIIPIREGVGGANSGDGGPEDPMLEQRVGKLEEKVDRIEAILMRLEPKITEIALTGAKQQDLQKTASDLAELKGRFGGARGAIFFAAHHLDYARHRFHHMGARLRHSHLRDELPQKVI